MNAERLRDLRHLLITGQPGVGKTTLIRKLAEALRDAAPSGFYTEEIRTHGVREGFRLVSLDGRRFTLSHVDHRGPYRVGRYGVDVGEFERLLDELNLSGSRSSVVVIDEIGKMECFSERFRREVITCLDSTRMVIATIALKGDQFIRDIKNRPDCRLVTVTAGNRDHLAGVLAAEVIKGLREDQ